MIEVIIHIVTTNSDIVISTDASLTGWGITDGNTPSKGFWHKTELDNISVLELKAIEIGMQSHSTNHAISHTHMLE